MAVVSARRHCVSHYENSQETRGKKPELPVCDDLVNRDLTATVANELWLVDITEHRTREGKLYLCAVKDVFSRRENVTGCVVYLDGSSQFRSRRCLRTLEYHGLVGSMGRVGAAGDNAAM